MNLDIYIIIIFFLDNEKLLLIEWNNPKEAHHGIKKDFSSLWQGNLHWNY